MGWIRFENPDKRKAKAGVTEVREPGRKQLQEDPAVNVAKDILIVNAAASEYFKGCGQVDLFTHSDERSFAIRRVEGDSIDRLAFNLSGRSDGRAQRTISCRAFIRKAELQPKAKLWAEWDSAAQQLTIAMEQGASEED